MGRLSLLCVLVLAGCAQRTLIRSQPDGASVYVDGKYAGATPIVISVPAHEFRNNALRREMTA
jgi:hypothetical protein